MEARCVFWNARHPSGTEVEYHPVLGRLEFRLPRTRRWLAANIGHPHPKFNRHLTFSEARRPQESVYSVRPALRFMASGNDHG